MSEAITGGNTLLNCERGRTATQVDADLALVAHASAELQRARNYAAELSGQAAVIAAGVETIIGKEK